MGRIKSVYRSKATSRGLAPKSNLFVRPNTSTEPSENSRSQNQVNEKLNAPATTAEARIQPESSNTHNPPSPATELDDTIEVKARIRQTTRKKYPSDVPRPSRPPFLPPIMQTGCIQTSKFKCLTAPTATEGKPDWDAVKYCLDCLRPHLVLYCDGAHTLVAQDCAFHQLNPDSSLRVKEYDRVRKRLETMFFKHGTMDSRPFTPPILKHRPGCGHKSELDGFDAELAADLREIAKWNRNGGEDQMHAAAVAKVDTPQRKVPEPAIARPTPANEDVIMIED